MTDFITSFFAQVNLNLFTIAIMVWFAVYVFMLTFRSKLIAFLFRCKSFKRLVIFNAVIAIAATLPWVAFFWYDWHTALVTAVVCSTIEMTVMTVMYKKNKLLLCIKAA